MFAGILKMGGMLILLPVYGKKIDRFKSLSLVAMSLLSFALIFWILCLVFLFSGIAANNSTLCIIYSIAFPVVIIVWTIYVRVFQNKR